MIRIRSVSAAALLTALLLAPVAFAADTVAPGAAAPNFSLPAQDSKPVSLTDFKGKWVVLYFYPKDQTSGCSLEAHNFQRDLTKYEALHAVVLGVSADTVESHKTWCTKDGFSFKMLSDADHKVIDAYGVPLMTFGGNQYATRETFLISPQGTVVKTWVVKDIANHSAEILAAIEAAKK
jgi:peroxiredoxin Q/BCP